MQLRATSLRAIKNTALINALTLADLWSAGQLGLWYDPSDMATLFQDSAGTTPVTAGGQPVGKKLDKSGRGNHALQADSAARPLTDYDTVGVPQSLIYDGVNDGMGTATFTAGTLGANMDCFIALRRNSAANVVLAYGSAAEYFGVVQSGSTANTISSAGTPTYLVNGTAVTATRDALHTALPVGSWHIFEARNLDLSTWTAFSFGAFSGFQLNGNEAEIVLAPAGDAAQRQRIRTYLGAKVGTTL